MADEQRCLIRKALDRLVARCIPLQSDQRFFVLLQKGDSLDEEEVLETVSDIFLDPEFTVPILGCFRAFTRRIVSKVVELLRLMNERSGEMMDMDGGEGCGFQFYFRSGWNLQLHEFAVFAFGRSLALAPFVLGLILSYFQFAPPPFECLRGSSFAATCQDTGRLLNVIRASYRLLELEPHVFSGLWDWSCVLDVHHWSEIVEPSKDSEEEIMDIRWCCIQILSVILRMSDRPSKNLGLTANMGLGCFLRWEDFCQDVSIEKAGWLVDEIKEENMETSNDNASLCEKLSVYNSLIASASHDHDILRVGITQNACNATLSFVLTSTMKRSFDSASLALSQEWPVLLHGPIGSGKTALINEMARVAGKKDVLFIYIDDQMDVKTLLGSYVCTETPGEFKWQPGSLTQAVVNGFWVVFEDIDKAPSEILSVIAPLLESRNLFIGSQAEILSAAKGFQLLATVSSSRIDFCNNIKGKSPLSGHWRKVSVDAASKEDMLDIVGKWFPSLRHITPKLIETIEKVNTIISSQHGGCNLGVVGSGGTFCRFSLRDLLKWCRRITDHGTRIYGLTLSDSQLKHIYQEGVDVFASSMASPESRLLLMKEIGKVWVVPEAEVEYLQRHHRPAFQNVKSDLQIGRCILETFQEPLQGYGHKFVNIGSSLRILEKVACAVKYNEPVLLVGETGTGKTTLVQILAARLGMPLTVLNLSQQTDAADLLGGFKPVDSHSICVTLLKEFNDLFSRTFPVQENVVFLQRIRKYANEKRWSKLLNAFQKAISTFKKPLGQIDKPARFRKRSRSQGKNIVQSWMSFSARVNSATKQITATSSMSFSFVEGALVKALKNGSWILLDEVNLAPPETLQRLTGVLEGEGGTLCLAERGDIDYIHRHRNFRIFACMNPATDAGKRDLPFSIRSRFTEIFVDDMLSDEDLDMFVAQYIEDVQFVEKPSVDIVKNISNFYRECRRQSEERLFDGAGQKPQFSLRSLARALEYTKIAFPKFPFEKALYDGFCMFFLTLLDHHSAKIMHDLIMSILLKGLGKKPQCIPFSYYCSNKQALEASTSDLYCKHYVLTESIKGHLNSLARAAFVRRYPVLLQGPTSSGKTSLVRYLATVFGRRFVRINNHEHTDLQEYFGSYVADTLGKLTFQEGILVEAVRKGYWIVLDELNLAPSDVLEALNRLLDDNREIFLPELQETVKPHPDFMLFATQNPPISYGGRKVLSRAFRNRFLEIHVDEIPEDELITILEHRCEIPRSYSIKMVSIMKDLQRHRQGSKVFAGKLGFITPRDLFRWADRFRKFGVDLAKDGYYILAERLRDESEKEVVKEVLKKHLRVEINKDVLYSAESLAFPVEPSESLQVSPIIGKITWTRSMQRLYYLVERCYQMREPVLLVGETGSGKTTICQLLSNVLGSQLHILNCHRYTETSDFLGGYYPVRERARIASQFKNVIEKLKLMKTFDEIKMVASLSPDVGDAQSTLAALDDLRNSLEDAGAGMVGEDVRMLEQLKLELLDLHSKWKSLFAWKDGPLVQAMKHGDLFLVDEISLADDSVLERLNSVMEPERKLVLAEKGGSMVEEITAHGNFFLLATMNPGGDFGKKELSPALRNRFTEIWVPPTNDLNELASIAEKRFSRHELLYLVQPLLSFWEWFHELQIGRVLTIRDLLSWIDFVNVAAQDLGSIYAFIHGAFLVLLDGLTLGTGISKSMAQRVRESCLVFLVKELEVHTSSSLENKVVEIGSYGWGSNEVAENVVVRNEVKDPHLFGIDPFYIVRGNKEFKGEVFQLLAPTTARNALRVLRAMQLPKPVLLEGSPGVGKTSLVVALSNLSGHNIVRINLSEETDIMDLLGSDLPVDGEAGIQFAWSDGILLQAIKSGSWVLLDELNLAPQAVLEGLNAILDHRAEVYIPELGLTFQCPPTFRVFACQNPTCQGGGRKGLPKSFLNRFTKVYVEELGVDDYFFICNSLYPSIPRPLLSKLISFNNRLYEDTMIHSAYGRSGSPWEFNLRDVLRACQLIEGSPSILIEDCFLSVVYLQRMRTVDDRKQVMKLYEEVFGVKPHVSAFPKVQITEQEFIVGGACISRNHFQPAKVSKTPLHLLPGMRHSMEAVVHCVKQGWCCILVGPPSSGKTSLIRLLSEVTGNTLHEYSLSSATDMSELLGCFEQYNALRRLRSTIVEIERYINEFCSSYFDADSRDPEIELCFVKKWLHLLPCSKASSVSGQNSFLGDPGYIDSLIEIGIEVCNYQEKLHLPLSCSVEELNSAIKTMSDSKESYASKSFSGKFEWVVGGLIKAVDHGEWVLLDNANLCNPTVLDRINSLLEPQGTITVNERGLVNGEPMVVQAHRGFRLFLTVDPNYGEVSRAMRNRGIEVFLLQPYWLASELEAACEEKCFELEDVKRFLVLSGIPCYKVIDAMARAHLYLKAEGVNFGLYISFLELSKWVYLYQKLLMNGSGNIQSLHLSMEHVYLSSFGSAAGKDILMRAASLYLKDLDAKTVDTLFESSLSMPGGWPSPLKTPSYLWYPKQAYVKENCMYVEFLASQFASYCTLTSMPPDHVKIHPQTLSRKHLLLMLFPTSSKQLKAYKLPKLDVGLVEKMLIFAANWAVEQATLKDIDLYIMWFRYHASKFEPYCCVLNCFVSMLEKMIAHPIWSELIACHEQITFDASTTPLLSMKVLEYQAASKSAELVKKRFLNAIQCVRLLQLSLLQWDREHVDVFLEPKSEILSIAEKSCYPMWRFLSYILPVFDSLKKLEARVLNAMWNSPCFDFLQQVYANIIDNHISFWKHVNSNQSEDMVLSWHLLKKEIWKLHEQFPEEVNEVMAAGRNLDQAPHWNCNFSISTFWKHGGHPVMPSSVGIFHQIGQLLGFCNKNWFLACSHDSEESLVEAMVFSNTEFRLLVMQGLSMAYLLASKRGESEDDIIRGLSDIYVMLFQRFESEKNVVRLSLLSPVGSSSAKSIVKTSACCLWFGNALCCKPLFKSWIKTRPLPNCKSLYLDMDVLQRLFDIFLADSNGQVEPTQVSKRLQYVVDFSLKFSSRLPRDFSPHQRIIWILDNWSSADSGKLSCLILELWFQWHSSLWTYSQEDCLGCNNYEFRNIVPNIFVHPIMIAADERLTANEVLIKDYASHCFQCRASSGYLWCHGFPRNNLKALLHSSVRFLLHQVISAHEKSFKVEDFAKIKSLAFSGENGCFKDEECRSLEELMLLLESSSDRVLRTLVGRCVAPLLKYLCSTDTPEGSLSDLGHAWLLIGVLHFRLLVLPNAPDPVAKYAYKLSQIMANISIAECEIKVRHECDFLIGTNCKDANNWLKESLAGLKEKQAKLQKKVVFRPEPTKYTVLKSHCDSFLDDVVLVGLAKELDSALPPLEQTLSKVSNWQETSSCFLQHLLEEYASYADLIQPIQVAIYEMKLGLSMLVSNALQKQLLNKIDKMADMMRVWKMLHFLMAFPSVGEENMNDLSMKPGVYATEWIAEEDVNFLKKLSNISSDVSNLELNVTVDQIYLAHVANYVRSSLIMDKASIKIMDKIFNQFVELWMKMKVQAKARVDNASKIYKFKPYAFKIRSILDVDVSRLRSVGNEGDWSSNWQDMLFDPEHVDEEILEDDWSRIEEPLLKNVVQVHSQLFGSPQLVSRPGRVEVKIQDRVNSFVLSYGFGRKILNGLPPSLPSKLDAHIMLGHLFHMCLESNGYADPALLPFRPYNFYKDPNAPQLVRIIKPLASLHDWVLDLLKEHPDQPPLEQISKTLKILIDIPLSTPLVQVLAMLQFLLGRIHSWEENTLKIPSITAKVQPIFFLVSDWLRMESDMWPGLLDDVQRQYESAAGKLWFPLYSIICQSSSTSAEDDGGSTIDVLEEFIETSSVGEFKSRLELLLAFHGQINMQLKLEAFSDEKLRFRLVKSSCILYNIFGYYIQYLPLVARYVSNSKASVKSELQELSKLTKWEHHSYHALMDSSKRTRQRLQKLVHKFNDMLQQPIMVIINQEVLRSGTDAPTLPVPTHHGCGNKTNLLPEVIDLDKLNTSNRTFWGNHWPKKIISILEHFGSAIQQIDFINIFEQTEERLQLNIGRMKNMLCSFCYDDIMDSIQEPYETGLKQVNEIFISSTHLVDLCKEKTYNVKKRRAFASLLKVLERSGLSKRKVEHDTRSWFLQPSFEVQHFLHLEELSTVPPFEIDHSSVGENIESMWRIVNLYYYRNWAMMQQLNAVRVKFHKDLTVEQVESSTSFIGNLVLIQQHHRVLAYGLSSKLQNLRKLLSPMEIHDVGVSATFGLTYKQRATYRSMWHQKTIFDNLCQIFRESLLLLGNIKGVHLSSCDGVRDDVNEFMTLIEKFTPVVQQSKVLLDRYLLCSDSVVTTPPMHPLLITKRMEEFVIQNFEVLSEIEKGIQMIGKGNLEPESGKDCLVRQLMSIIDKGKEIKMEFNLDKRPEGQAEREQSQETSFVENFKELGGSFIDSLEGTLKEVMGAFENNYLCEDYALADECISGNISKLDCLFKRKMEDLNLDHISDALQRTIISAGKLVDYADDKLSKMCSRWVIHLRSLFLLVDMALCAGERILFQFLVFHRSVAELTSVLADVFLLIYREGFGVAEIDQDEGSSDAKCQDATGTGMGEGEGITDVSNQIDDEEQLLGASDKSKGGTDPGDPMPSGNDMGIEMEQDFDGDTFSLSDDSEEHESEGGDDVNLESVMGQTGDDNEIVDEMPWDKDKDASPDDNKERYEKGPSIKEPDSTNKELGAMEDPSSHMDEDEGLDNDKLTKQQEQDVATDGGSETSEDKNMEKENASIDDAGIHYDDEEFNLGEMEANEDDDPNGAVREDLAPDETVDQSHDLEGKDEDMTEVNSSEDGSTPGNEDGTAALEDLSTCPLEKENDEGKQLDQANVADQLVHSTNSADGVNASNSLESSQGPDLQAGNDNQFPHAVDGLPKNDIPNPQSFVSCSSKNGDMTAGQTMESPSVAESVPVSNKTRPNPCRSMGDALKEWKERVRMVSETDTNKLDQLSETDDENGNEFRFVSELEKSTSQALDTATSDRIDQKANLKNSSSMKEDFDDHMIESSGLYAEENYLPLQEVLPSSHLAREETPSVLPEPQCSGVVSDGIESPHDDERIKSSSGDITFVTNANFKDGLSKLENHPMNNLELNKIRKDVAELSHDVTHNANKIWASYEKVTGSLSQELAEQLRLVMEPTLASKLQGDYRTGKRINMKKVIPYIASHFRKDKIWLRRTRPSKRDYQVVVAIDDSRSMAESQCGHIAIEALITVCRAMSQLEVGQVAVASFGEKGNIQLLQDFHQPFTSEAGIKMISSLSFKQDNSILDDPMVDLLNYLNGMLDAAVVNARLPSGQNPLQQLILIIADGRFHEKENLRRRVRDALTQRRMIAFIIVDSPHESIMDVQSVSFVNGSPIFSKYLDTFPFPYYIILSNIEALPRTLSGLLRQWFELMQIADE